MQFEKAVQALCDGGVDFVVIGGLAATLHGSAQVTYDLDICYSRASANLRRLTEALAPFHPRPRGFPVGLPFVWDEATLRNGTVFTLQTDIGEIVWAPNASNGLVGAAILFDVIGEIQSLAAWEHAERT
jgi:hypothetical protein